MNRAQLEQLKSDVQQAADAMQIGDTADALEHLIDAMLTLSEHLEETVDD